MACHRRLVWRVFLLAPALASLLMGLFGGLARMGLVGPAPSHILLGHGVLMMLGFIASLIALERFVALRSWWSLPSYLLLAVGGVFVAAGYPSPGVFLLVLGSAAFLALHLWILLRHRQGYLVLMSVSCLLLFIGNLKLFFGLPIFEAALSWIGFLILFIMGERMEMARLRGFRYPFSAPAYIAAFLLLAAGVYTPVAVELASSAALILPFAVARFDLGLRFIRGHGFQRYLASGLVCGYIWLGLGGLLMLLRGYHDSALHAIFLGFAGTMIMTHAPVIFPVIMKTKHLYAKNLYIPLGLLQGSTILRAPGLLDLWKISGILTTASVASFMILTFYNLRRIS
ncbi:hypothetical protein HRbin01_00148 [archaeon HR01]|nr:hypothetical protein HRbin01_00148 [archaeon HR01]